MSDHASDSGRWDRPDAQRPNSDPDGVGRIEAYEDDEGETVVLFDEHNPLAWVEATRAVTLRDYA